MNDSACYSERFYFQFLKLVTSPLETELQTVDPPPLGGTISAPRLLNTGALCAGSTRPIPHGTIGKSTNVVICGVREF